MLSPFATLSDKVPATLSPPKNLGVFWEDLARLRIVRVAELLRKVEQNVCSALLLKFLATDLLGANVEYRGKPLVLEEVCLDITVEYCGSSWVVKSGDSNEYAGSCVCRLGL